MANRLRALRERRDRLKRELRDEMSRPSRDMFRIARLKKQNLVLKEEIMDLGSAA